MSCPSATLPDSLVSRASIAWAALLLIVEVVFVPRGLSVPAFAMLLLTGPILLLSGARVQEGWRHRARLEP